PQFGFGALAFQTDLLDGGFATRGEFGGSGPLEIDTLGAYQVYATLVLEATQFFTVSASLGGVNFLAAVESLDDGEVLYVRPPGLTTVIDQRLDPGGEEFAGQAWQSLGVVTVGIDNPDIEVRISAAAEGLVAADAVRLVRVDLPVQQPLPALEVLGFPATRSTTAPTRSSCPRCRPRASRRSSIGTTRRRSRRSRTAPATRPRSTCRAGTMCR
ncbi:MAG: hypothetical protein ACREU4_12870, partial [Burkholderiales bacterium]